MNLGTTFHTAKHGLLRCKTWPFAAQFTAFRRAIHGLSQSKRRPVGKVLAVNGVRTGRSMVKNKGRVPQQAAAMKKTAG